MSNYTGGARNNYRRRRIGPVSGSRRTAFTSKGLAVSARQETISVPSRPRFDFFHANDASERIVNTGSGPLIGRIDAVSPESIRDPPKPPPNQTKFHASSPYMGYDVTARNKELSRRDLIKLPKRKEAEGSDVHSLQQILRNPSTSLHDSKDGIRDHGSMDVTSSIYNDWTTHLHQEQEINFELDSSGSHSGCTEEILSFPPTPSGRFLQPSTISSYDLIRDLDEKSEDHMSDDDEIISFSGEVAAQPSQNDIASSSSILSSVSKAPSPPLVAFRLPGDRSGLGKPLNRWIGDGKEDEAALSNSSEHPDSFSDEDTMHLHDSEDWILQPYEQMLPVGQSATSIATNSEDIGMATRHAGLSLNISSPTITLNEEDSTRLVRPQIGNVQREDLPDDPGSQELSLDDVYNELKNSLKASNQTIEDQPLFFLAPSLF